MYPNKKPNIMVAEKKIRGLWIRELSRYKSWEKTIIACSKPSHEKANLIWRETVTDRLLNKP